MRAVVISHLEEFERLIASADVTDGNCRTAEEFADLLGVCRSRANKLLRAARLAGRLEDGAVRVRRPSTDGERCVPAYRIKKVKVVK